MMHVYRFHELIAINPPQHGDTFYLRAGEAKQLAKALLTAYRSVQHESFQENEVGTIKIDCTGSLHCNGS